VVAPTTFADCTHEAGERMWTEIARRPDGSYWGLHRWFFSMTGGKCVHNPTPGPTAWRLLPAKGGTRFLRVCFSEPGSGAQPLVAPGGAASDVTYGCFDSALIAPLPRPVPGTYVPPLPPPPPAKGGCRTRSKLRIRVRSPRNDPVKELAVTLKGGKIRRRGKVRWRGRHHLIATLVISDLPPTRRFTIRVRVKTTLGRRITRKRTYGRCAPKRRRAAVGKKGKRGVKQSRRGAKRQREHAAARR
jgi:hypothetical protein